MRYITTLLLMLLALGAIAQADPEANALLDKTVERVKSYPAVEITFTVTLENPTDGTHETHNGQAWLKGEKYRLDLMDTETYYDGTLLYNYLPEVLEVNIKTPDAEDNSILNPATLFDIPSQGTARLIAKENGIAHIELRPQGEADYDHIGIWLDASTYSLQRVTAYTTDGATITVTLHTLKALDPAPSDSFFRFDTEARPDVEVIDLR